MTPEMIDNLEVLVAKIEENDDSVGGVGAGDLMGDGPLSDEPLLNEVVFSMLLWEGSLDHAMRAVDRIRDELVDLNELRVCSPDELGSIMGARMPRSTERAGRLIRVLNEIYLRENTLSLASHREMTKRDVQEYLDSIDGLPLYAGSRMILFGLGWHAFPLDERLAKLLGSRGIITPSNTLAQQAAQLERGVRATDALRTYTLIERWAQTQRGTSRPRKSSAGKSRSKGVS